jgi:biopolymer transport protein ExbD
VKFKRQVVDEVDVNITPLIDVVFLLLIFFMVSTTFKKESHLKIDLPQASATSVSADKKNQIEVVIDSKGNYSLGDRQLVNNQEITLNRALEKVAGKNRDVPFIITADAKTPHEYVVRVMDVAGQMGFVHLSITTTRMPKTQ